MKKPLEFVAACVTSGRLNCVQTQTALKPQEPENLVNDLGIFLGVN